MRHQTTKSEQIQKLTFCTKELPELVTVPKKRRKNTNKSVSSSRTELFLNLIFFSKHFQFHRIYKVFLLYKSSINLNHKKEE